MKTRSSSGTKSTAATGPILQRKCSCGSKTTAGEQCKACRAIEKKKMLQRKATSEHGVDEVPQIVYDVLRSPGQPLDAETRSFMERSFGCDFSNVRVHTDAMASRSAEAVDAAAYAVGPSLVFRRGMYRPRSADGIQLLAHELAHVSKTGGNAAPVSHGLAIGPAESENERYANQAASTILASHAALGLAPDNTRNVRRPQLSIQRDSGGNVVQRQTWRERAAQVANSLRNAISPRNRQAIADLIESVRQSPQYFAEFFTGELYDTVRANWLSILGVTLGLFVAESIIGALEAAPTGVTQVVGAVLQVLVLAVLGYFAAVETVAAVQEGIRWWTAARDANGNVQNVATASRSFVRMIWHIFMAILAVAGVRARVRAGAVGRATAPLRSAPAETAPSTASVPQTRPPLRSIPGGQQGPVPMRNGRVVGRPQNTTPSASRGPVGSAGEAAARPLPVEPAPVQSPTPLRAVPEPVAETAPRAAAPGSGSRRSPTPFVQPEIEPKPNDDSRRTRCEHALPISWPLELPVPEELAKPLLRMSKGDREWEGIERGAAQASMQRRIRENRAQLIPPPQACFPGLDEPNTVFDAHHSQPLYLGGEDALYNLCAIETDRHKLGHRRLDNQNEHIQDYEECGIHSPKLSQHPIGQEYIITGDK